MNIVMIVSLALFLAISSVQDVRKHQISLWTIICFTVIGVFEIIMSHNLSVIILAGGAVGLVLIGLALLSRGNLGIGDGLVFLVTGIYMGGVKNLVLLFYSSLLASVVGMGVLLVFKKNKKSKLPLVPFIAVSYMGMMIGGYL